MNSTVDRRGVCDTEVYSIINGCYCLCHTYNSNALWSSLPSFPPKRTHYSQFTDEEWRMRCDWLGWNCNVILLLWNLTGHVTFCSLLKPVMCFFPSCVVPLPNLGTSEILIYGFSSVLISWLGSIFCLFLQI